MNILKSGEPVAEKRCKNESVLVNPRKENGKKKNDRLKYLDSLPSSRSLLRRHRMSLKKISEGWKRYTDNLQHRQAVRRFRKPKIAKYARHVRPIWRVYRCTRYF